MDMYLGRKQTPESNVGLREEVVLQLTKDLERSFLLSILTIFLIVQTKLKNYSKKAFMVLEQFEPTEIKCQK